jgi:hypothetical protein
MLTRGFLSSGAYCHTEGMTFPNPKPGYWRKYLPDPGVDPYFIEYRIYECNPETICLGRFCVPAFTGGPSR